MFRKSIALERGDTALFSLIRLDLGQPLSFSSVEAAYSRLYLGTASDKLRNARVVGPRSGTLDEDHDAPSRIRPGRRSTASSHRVKKL